MYRIDISSVAGGLDFRLTFAPSDPCGYPDGVSFGPASVEGASISSLPGQIDYRLARNSVVRDFQRGRLSRLDVCDAHPELLRAARHVGDPTTDDCPICKEVPVVHVSFVFGPRIPPGGRCVTSRAEMAKLARGVAQIVCYVVEVCPACSWNHLARMQVLGGRPRS